MSVILPGHSVPLNPAELPASAAASVQLFSWSVGCFHLHCCCFLWRKWGAALEAGNAALAGKHLISLHFLYILTSEYGFKAQLQEICLPGFSLTTSCSGLDPSLDSTAVAAGGWTGLQGKQEVLWGRSIPLAFVQPGTATITNKAWGEWVSQTSPQPLWQPPWGHSDLPRQVLSETRVLNSRKSRQSWSMVCCCSELNGKPEPS